MNTPDPNKLRLHRLALLRVGGVSVLGGFLGAFRPLDVRAAEKAKPRGTARQVLFLNLEGGMSQVDSLDAKQGSWTPDYFDIRPCHNGLQLPHGLMPNLAGM